MHDLRPLLALGLLFAPALRGQAPAELFVQPNAPRVNVPQIIQWSVFGRPNALYGVFGDTVPGPTPVLGIPLNLGLSGNLLTLDTGVLSLTGSAAGSMLLTPPPGLAGQPFYVQHLELLGGRVRAGNPEGLGFHGGRFAIEENFRARRWTGTYDGSVFYRLQAASVRTRTQRTIDPVGVPFPQPVRNPLNTFGARTQMVFRPVDVGATGEPELLTAVRWRPLGPIAPQVHPLLDLLASHTDVVPDYTVDPFTALPAAPNSGLDPAFAQNPRGPSQQVMFAGAYSVRVADQTASGYMPYPIAAPFPYDGRSSLLLEMRVSPNLVAAGNGQAGRIMVQSSPDPAARLVAEGTAASPLTQPSQAMTGRGDNFLYDYELEFVRVESEALSPFYPGLVPNPDYLPPIVCDQVPPGTSYGLFFRGADDAQGTNPTPWSANQDIADGRPFLQMRVQFAGNPRSGAVPFLDNVVIPIR